jgi:hypothetical protein
MLGCHVHGMHRLMPVGSLQGQLNSISEAIIKVLYLYILIKDINIYKDLILLYWSSFLIIPFIKCIN